MQGLIAAPYLCLKYEATGSGWLTTAHDKDWKQKQNPQNACARIWKAHQVTSHISVFKICAKSKGRYELVLLYGRQVKTL